MTGIDKLVETLGYAVLGFGVLCIIALMYMIPLYFLWNWIMPIVFNISEITLWQSLGMLLLTGMLFRSKSSSKKD